MKLRIAKEKSWVSLEKLYAVLTLFVMTRPLRHFMIVGSVDVQFLMVVGSYCIILPFVLRRTNRFVWIASRDKVLVFLICLVLLSTVWSANPVSTLKNSAIFLGGAFFGIYLAMRYSLREQMQIFAWMLGITGVLSMIVALAFPAVGTITVKAGGGTAWSGLWDHKNKLGRYMATSAILSWIFRMDSRKKWRLWGSFFFSVGLILLARSASPLVALVVTFGLMLLYKALRWLSMRAVSVFISGVLLAASVTTIVVAANPDVSSDLFFSVLGRDPDRNTLQVRIDLWEVLLNKVQRRPWLGYGFGDTWTQVEGGASMAGYGSWEPKQAHNGYLEILLQLGLVGLVAMVYHLLLNFRRGMMLARLAKTSEGLWALAYLTMLSVFNLTESIFLGQLTIPWTFYVALTLSMCVQLDRTNVASAKRQRLDTVYKSVPA